MLKVLEKIKKVVFMPLVSKFRVYADSNKKNMKINPLNINSNTEDLIYLEDLGTGYLTGPECFSLKSDGGYYVLDTAKKIILSFDGEGKKNHVFTYADLSVSKISADKNDILFIIDTASRIIGKIDNFNNMEKYFINNVNTDALIDFGVKNNGNIFIVLADKKGGKTYELKLFKNKAEFVSVKNGRLSENGKNYKTTLVKDKGFDIGHSCIITIFNELGNVEKELTLKSDHWIEGAVYLGEIDGCFIVKTHEIEVDINNNIIFEELIKKIDINDNVIGILTLPKKHKYVQNDVKVKGTSIYHLNCQKTHWGMEKLELSPPDIFKSTLKKQSLKSNDTLIPNNTPLLTLNIINRSFIQQIADDYYRYRWHCSLNNYSTYRKSIRPRYINNYNLDYQRVPYNWGGWDSLDGFAAKISEGKTVGNINTKKVYSIIAGVDCSGYVQRCWGLNDSKRNTLMLDYPSISYKISVLNIKFGDAWNSTGHIMIYQDKDGYGNYILYESTLLNGYDGVYHTARAISYVESNYHLIRRLNIIEDV